MFQNGVTQPSTPVCKTRIAALIIFAVVTNIHFSKIFSLATVILEARELKLDELIQILMSQT